MTKTHSPYEELEPEYLDVVAGGASRVLSRESQIGIPFVRPSSHHWETRSDPFPPGTTREEANELVNRFNAPTDAALHAHGNDPKADHDVVVGPFGIPAGRIDVDHHTSKDGYAEAVNSTAFPHVFHGTTTRSVIDSPEGYRAETVGDGEGHIPVFDDIRHGVNSAAGPEAFGDLDAAMMREAASRLHGAQDSEPHASEPHASEPHTSGPIGSESYARAQGSEPQASESQASESPASESPASESPASEPHATEPHASEPHATEPHASESPGSESPSSQSQSGESQGSESQGSESQGSQSQGGESQGGDGSW
jgi:hypothetical protein